MADLEGLHVGEFGKAVELYCRKSGVIQNLSAYSTGSAYEYTVRFWSPKPVKIFELSDSDGAGPGSSTAETSGIVKFSCSSAANKFFDRAGMWEGQIWIVGTGTRIKSDKFSVLIGE